MENEISKKRIRIETRSGEYFKTYRENNKEAINERVRAYLKAKTIEKHDKTNCLLCGKSLAGTTVRAKHCESCRLSIKRAKSDRKHKKHPKKLTERIVNAKKVYRKANSDNLLDPFIKEKLIHCDGFTKEQLNQYPEIIETKRTLIKIKRLCKTLQN